MKRYKIRIVGRVQGVYFRYYTQKKALQLHLSGWVQNMPDTSVAIEVQGDEDNLSDFINWCKRGSLMSRVDGVEFNQINLGEFQDKSFKILKE
jgi:acylphosphatase